MSAPDAALRTERFFAVAPHEVFAAFEQPARLANWWGPSGFTNTFERLEFRPGGRWAFMMHAPNGADYPNRSVARKIPNDPGNVIEHVVKSWFILTGTLTAHGDSTHLTWVQEFEGPEVTAPLPNFVDLSNEQDLDRLQALLAGDDA